MTASSGEDRRSGAMSSTSLILERLADASLGPPSSLVTFARESVRDNPWTGGEAVPSGPALPDRVFGGPPSRLVWFADCERHGPGPLDQLRTP